MPSVEGSVAPRTPGALEGRHPSSPSGTLSVRLTWLTALRLIVVTVFLVVTTTVYLGGFTPGGFSSKVALTTVASAYALAALYAVALRRGRGLETVALLQLVTDQITWTAIIYISGGATSGATSLYGLTCLSGAILLGMRGALVAAVSGALAFVLLCGALGSTALLPPVDQPPEAYVTRLHDLAYPLFVNLLAIAVVTLLAAYLAERLRATGGRLVQATAQVEKAEARAEQAERLAALGRVAAALAHEIRNPLGSIAGSIELLRTGGTLSAEDRKLCEIIERETARLNDLVGDMLQLARPRAPSKADLDLAATAREVVLLAARSGRGEDVPIRYDGLSTLLVQADAAQMRQVVWNLARNAIQASSADVEVVVRVRAAPPDAVLEIVDHGPGISPEAQERLFDAFFTTRSQGAGIGLAVVKQIATAHGFAVEVDSVENEGTTFRIRIPGAAPNGVSASAAPVPPVAPDATTHRGAAESSSHRA
jgi:two-component system sensor histidine kinase HydH